jgi:hypothetical protein
MNYVLREQDFGLVVCDSGMDNDIITLLPVDRGGNAVLITNLQG